MGARYGHQHSHTINQVLRLGYETLTEDFEEVCVLTCFTTSSGTARVQSTPAISAPKYSLPVNITGVIVRSPSLTTDGAPRSWSTPAPDGAGHVFWYLVVKVLDI